MMNEMIFMVAGSEEGGFTAKSLTEAIFTQAETMAELKSMIKEAVRCHFGGEINTNYLLVTS